VELKRRCFLKRSTAAAMVLLASPKVFAHVETERRIGFSNQHTGELVDAVYWADGQYVPDELARINHVLRDHRTDDIFPIEPGLLDVLHNLRRLTGLAKPFDLVSGYRSPKTNAMLHETTKGVAKKSFHMMGMAADVWIAGYDLRRLRDAAVSLKAGGVGYYAKSGFIHVDIGRTRYW